MAKIQTNQEGFTLFEIAVSIGILGTALGTILGLQTSIINRYSNENNIFHASLYAQYMMSLIEADNEKNISSQSGSLKNALTDLGYFDDSLSNKGDDLDGWTYETEVEPIQIPGREDDGDVLERVDLTVSWSEAEDTRFHLVFYRKIKEQNSEDGSSEQ